MRDDANPGTDALPGHESRTNENVHTSQLTNSVGNHEFNQYVRGATIEQKTQSKLEEFWKPKLKTQCNIEINSHMGIIASKSLVLSQLLIENIQAQEGDKSSLANDKKKIVVDFKGKILYQAFKKIIDFCYLDDISILN